MGVSFRKFAPRAVAHYIFGANQSAVLNELGHKIRKKITYTMRDDFRIFANNKDTKRARFLCRENPSRFVAKENMGFFPLSLGGE